MRFVSLAAVALVVFSAASIGNASVAHAQDDVSAAKSHSQKGTRLYQVGDYRQALEEFKAAHLAKPDPAFLYNIAQCHRQLGEYEAAVTLYKRFLAASPNAANRAEVERRVADLEADLAARRRTAAPPAGPAPLGAPDGKAGLGAAAPATASLVPESSASARSESAEPVASAPAESSLRTLRWVGAGLTLALVGGAIAMGLSASSRFDDLKNTCGATTSGCSSGQIDGVKSRALVTNILWGAAGVAALGTGIVFYLTPRASAVQVAWSF